MKKILLGLFLGFVGLINFSYGMFCSPIEAKNTTLNPYQQINGSIDWTPLGTTKYCIVSNDGDISISILGESFTLHKNDGYCVDKSDIPNGVSGFPISCNSSSCSLGRVLFGGDCKFMSSMECQTEYNLIPIGEVDTNYCVNNGLCPSNSCDFSGFSNFYVRHGESTWSQLTGTENYYVYLPDYLGFNYDYSNNGSDLNFTVGVSVDTGYIDNVNVIQNSKPSQEDLNRLISEIIPLFVPGLAVILLLYFIFRFIKKIF